MGDRCCPRPACLALLGVLLLSGRLVRGAEFYCDERSQTCEPEPCSGCSLDVIYRSYTECQLSCSHADADMASPWSCVLPSEQGPCRDAVRRWHFDIKEGECRDFSYGGCLGNSNNFGSLAECRSVCEYRISEILPQLNITLGTRGEEERCLLPRPDGVCSQDGVGQPRFAYDQETGQCASFEWHGCQEGGNVFSSVLACQIPCEGIRPVLPVYPPPMSARASASHELAEQHKADMAEDEDHDPCLLPADPGTCGADSPRLFFDAALGVCRRFLFGGCGGNLNNFRTLDSCYRTCNNASVAATPAEPACLEPKQEGSCGSSVIRFYYDAATSRCRAFRYSGCDGSANNFLTLESCAAACRPPAAEMPSLTESALVAADLGVRARRVGGPSAVDDLCSFPPEAGPCLAEQTRWHYDPVVGRCRKFLYGGCEGNANNFASLAACRDSCGRRAGPDRRQAECSGPAKRAGSRRCFASIPRFTFNEARGRCERVVFDGCGAAANNYRTRLECERACLSRPPSGQADRVCQLRPDPGRCEAQIDRYYYDPASGRCRRFIYGGCRGNANNFETMRECMSMCRAVGPDGGGGGGGSEVDCSAPPVHPRAPSCTARIRRFYYSVPEGRCVSLLYGGCGATDNNFATLAGCERSCPPGAVNETEVCLAPPAAPGDCLSRVVRYTYDPAAGTCRQFDYTGCGGNDNNFATSRDCLDLCRGVTGEQGKDVCLLRPDPGPCTGLVDRYFYNADTGRCQLFSYGGCEGNGNNFGTAMECQKSCSDTTVEPGPGVCAGQPGPGGAICQERSLVGPCAGSITRYYFDQFENRCQQFIYSGCGGNSNNFATRRECECACPGDTRPDPDTGKELCRLSPEIGPCFAALPRFYYDSRSGTCREFTYGGCSGNANNFETLAACLRRCGDDQTERPARCLAPASSGRPGTCGVPRQAGTFFYSTAAGRCLARPDDACGDSENSFRSAAACREECVVPAAARAVCLLPIARGECAGRQRRWAFDARSGRCQPFEFGGCNGNDNNFATLAACLTACRGMRVNSSTALPAACLEPLVVDDFCEPLDRPETRWSFNAETMRCQEFESSGCDVGPNMYPSRSACERQCRPDPPPPESGSCGREPRPVFGCTPGRQRTVYFYSANRGICLSLIDDGCLSGDNMYPTRQACLRACAGGDGDGAVCRLPIEPGRRSCNDRLPRWAFSTVSGRCERFTFSGCDGNGNNFETLAACRDRCREDANAGGDREPPELCLQPPRRLLGCRPSGRQQRFYYNRERRTCDSFTFRGCDTGDNIFTSRQQCLSVCSPTDGGDGRDDQPEFCRAEPVENPGCRPGQRSTKYYFSTAIGRCRSFISVDCERGRNVFLTLRECERACEDSGTDNSDGRPQFCLIRPQEVSNCRPGNRETKYYFSVPAGRCLSFTSFGCESGKNIFLRLRECEEACDGDSAGGDGGMPQFCRLEPEEMPDCRPGDRTIKYYYSPTAGRCRSFTSFGCERGRNLFSTMRQCEEVCDSRNSGDDVCSLRPDPGRCTRFETRWYHDQASGTCRRFEYGGCGGNGNRFLTSEACETRCNDGTRAENELCNQPPETGERPCQREAVRYFWDTASGVCRSYRYSGCGATENNFVTLRECSSTCRRRGGTDGERPPAPARCLEEPEQKPANSPGCGLQQKRYTYSSRQGFCIPFIYTGCVETDNNFLSRQECRDTCQPRDQCLLRAEPGRCDRRLVRYAYDPATDGCQRFVYTGCGGNANRFASERACVLSCGRGAAAAGQEVCLLPPVEDGSVNCGVRETRYFFDSALGRCVSFTFTGCVPTENNFVSLMECQQMCPSEEPARLDDGEVCALERAPGSCLSRVLRFFYDATERRCRPFVYTGCDGNANNFLTFRNCSNTCTPRLRSLELGEQAVLSEVRQLTQQMAAETEAAVNTALEP